MYASTTRAKCKHKKTQIIIMQKNLNILIIIIKKKGITKQKKRIFIYN